MAVVAAVGASPARAGWSHPRTVATGTADAIVAAGDTHGHIAALVRAPHGLELVVRDRGGRFRARLLPRTALTEDEHLAVDSQGGVAMTWTINDESRPADPYSRDEDCCLRAFAAYRTPGGHLVGPQLLSPPGLDAYVTGIAARGHGLHAAAWMAVDHEANFDGIEQVSLARGSEPFGPARTLVGSDGLIPVDGSLAFDRRGRLIAELAGGTRASSELFETVRTGPGHWTRLALLLTIPKVDPWFGPGRIIVRTDARGGQIAAWTTVPPDGLTVARRRPGSVFGRSRELAGTGGIFGIVAAMAPDGHAAVLTGGGRSTLTLARPGHGFRPVHDLAAPPGEPPALALGAAGYGAIVVPGPYAPALTVPVRAYLLSPRNVSRPVHIADVPLRHLTIPISVAAAPDARGGVVALWADGTTVKASTYHRR